ncbi:MAG: alpha-1,2-fucosyltransferase [Hyphomicrobiales bacterium]|nr:alpha-1,2-fucosyltransferase [Hyphomicrobiales bacterium]
MANERVVATRMLGGLGNQLFQYATGRALATRLDARLILDCTPRGGPNRPFVLDRYRLDADIVRNAPGKLRHRHFRLPTAIGRRLTDRFHDHLPTRIRLADRSLKVFAERGELIRAKRYDHRFAKLSGSIYLTGYWQSFRYFDAITDDLRQVLRPIAPLSEANRNWLGRIITSNAVCLHVRRGDYLTSKDGFARTCSLAYYQTALAHVRRFLPASQVFVFSDDIAWCRTVLAAFELCFVDANGPDDAVDELCLMAACRHHVIANSSLSWWGAWLAHHHDQLVIAPWPWVSTIADHADFLPSNWLKLPKS